MAVSYRANDLEELEEAEVLVNKFLADHHLDENEIKIQDIDTKIEKLKEQIQKIKETNLTNIDSFCRIRKRFKTRSRSYKKNWKNIGYMSRSWISFWNR